MLASSFDIAKLTQPRLGHIYSRERLNSTLKEASNSPIIWICAPPGSGKTTLVTDYIASNKLKCLWLQVDQDDADAANIFHYLSLGADKLSPKFEQRLPALTPEYSLGLSTFSRNYFRELFSRFPKKGVLVLDNFQQIGRDSKVHELLAEGFAEISASRQIIIVSRENPSAEYSRLLINQQIVLVDGEELDLTAEEQEGVYQLRTKSEKKQSNPLTEECRSCSWMAGFILMLEHQHDEGRNKIGKLSPEGNFQALFDYFTNEVFAKTDLSYQSFLVKTAFIPMISIESAQELTSNMESEQILTDLRTRNFFIHCHSGSPPRYQYHPMFRDFLLNRAKEILSEEDYTSVRLNAAIVLEHDGQIEAAAETLCDLREWDKLSEIVLNHARSMIEQGRHHSLQKWLEVIPDNFLDEDPWLLFWYGESLSVAEPMRSLDLYHKAMLLFDNKNDGEGALACWSKGMEAIRIDYSNERRSMAPWMEQGDNLRKKYQEKLSDQLEARVAFAMLNAIWWEFDDHPEAEYWCDRCYDYAHFLDQDSYIFAKTWVVFYTGQKGDMARAYQVICEIWSELDSLVVAPNTRISFYIADLIYWIRLGQYGRTYESVQRAEAIANESGLHANDIFIHSFGVFSGLASGNVKEATRHVDFLDKNFSFKKGDEGVYCHMTLGWFAYLTGDFTKAKGHIDHSTSLAEKGCRCRYIQAQALLGKANIYLLAGDEKAAFKHMETSYDICKVIRADSYTYQVEILKAYFYLESDKKQACELLESCLSFSRKTGICGFLWWNPKVMRETLSFCLRENIETDMVQNLIRQRNVTLESPPYDIEKWPWPIKVYSLGEFRIEKDGVEVIFGRKAPKKPLELLKIIISLGASEIREGKLMDLLWPDAEADAAQNSLNSAVHRIRQIIGSDILIIKDRKISLDQNRCWVDAFAFKGLIDRSNKSEGNDKKNLLDNALQLYERHYLLSDKEHSWSVTQRETLRNKYIGVVNRLGQYHIDQESWQKAIDCYKDGLEMDNLTEEFYQGTIKSYQALGLNAEAADAYHQCKKALSISLGIKPSSKTQSLYQKVMNSE